MFIIDGYTSQMSANTYILIFNIKTSLFNYALSLSVCMCVCVCIRVCLGMSERVLANKIPNYKYRWLLSDF